MRIHRHQNQITTKYAFWEAEYEELFRCLAIGEYVGRHSVWTSPSGDISGQCFLQPLNNFSDSVLLPSQTSSIIFWKTSKLIAMMCMWLLQTWGKLSCFCLTSHPVAPWAMAFVGFAREACLGLRLSLSPLSVQSFSKVPAFLLPILLFCLPASL